MNGPTPAGNGGGNEEPDLALEPDLPSDGRDIEGETMIRKLPERPELSDPQAASGDRKASATR